MEHGSIGHNNGPYDVLLHVPLIVRPPKSWPGPPAAEVEAVHELRSVAATLRHAAGIEPGRGGPSLVPYLLGRDLEPGPRFAVAESSLAVSVRTARHRLIADRQGGGMQLFDRTAEPLERTDVASEEPEALAELVGHLRSWQRQLEPLAPVAAEIDEETVQGLRDLGYID
jgi:hypothetical protein